MLNTICYTHSKCLDVHNLYSNQYKKHCSYNLTFLCDTKINDDTFVYSNDDQYYIQWLKFLENYKESYFIYNQEDFILYNDVNESVINNLIKILNETDYSFIRLIRSGVNILNKYDDNLYITNEQEILMSLQCCLWKTEDFKKIMDTSECPNIRYENILDITARNLNIKGLVYYDNTMKRGMDHYDSNIWPYIATALVNGKWNIKEYKNELTPLLKEYIIDDNIRGKFK
jgi:hypothetical protein